MEKTNTERLYDVIKQPLITEKSMTLVAKGQYTFEVKEDAMEALNLAAQKLPIKLRVIEK